MCTCACFFSSLCYFSTDYMAWKPCLKGALGFFFFIFFFISINLRSICSHNSSVFSIWFSWNLGRILCGTISIYNTHPLLVYLCSKFILRDWFIEHAPKSNNNKQRKLNGFNILMENSECISAHQSMKHNHLNFGDKHWFGIKKRAKRIHQYWQNVCT